MKIERVNRDKIRIYLSAEELVERGIKRDEMAGPFPHLHDLLMEMMEKAATEIGFEAEGPLAVEVFSMASQGMVLVVTRPSRNNNSINEAKDDADEEDFDLFKSYSDEDDIEVDVTIETQNKLTYAFDDLENVLSVMKRLYQIDVMLGQLYHYQNRYVLQFSVEQLNKQKVKGRSIKQKEAEHKKLLDFVETVLQEFGDVNFVTEDVLQEYGKIIVQEDAVKCMYEKMHLGPVKKTRRPRAKKVVLAEN